MSAELLEAIRDGATPGVRQVTARDRANLVTVTAFESGDDPFLSVDVHPRGLEGRRVFVGVHSGQVAVSVGHATLWLTAAEAADLSARLSVKLAKGGLR